MATQKYIERMRKREDYQKKLKDMIERVGDWNTNYYQLSKDWGVPNQTLYRWKDKILADMDLIKPEIYGRDILNALRTSIKQCQLKSQTTESESMKIKYMQTISELAKTITDILERYNKKRKIAETVELVNKSDYTIEKAYAEAYGANKESSVEDSNAK